jgi:hypothetical protein
VLQSNPLDDLSQSGKIVVDVRKRKGMNPAVPPLSDYEVRHALLLAMLVVMHASRFMRLWRRRTSCERARCSRAGWFGGGAA